MLDPDFDPLKDLHSLMLAVSAQHSQIESLIKIMNDHNRAIQNINSAIKVLKHQSLIMEKNINDIKQASTDDSRRQ